MKTKTRPSPLKKTSGAKKQPRAGTALKRALAAPKKALKGRAGAARSTKTPLRAKRVEVLLAPAKLNLRLKVEGRRFDGYHLLSMLNVKVGLYDRLRIAVAEAGAVKFSVKPTGDAAYDAVLADPEKNLAARAAQAFLDQFKLAWGVSIALEKNIPAGAGLGGGSSDAAAVLRSLKAYYLGHKSLRAVERRGFENALLSIALRIGADVPYFLYRGLAHVGGVGQEVFELDSRLLKNVHCLLCIPGEKIETRSLYDSYRERTRDRDFELDYAGRTTTALSALSYASLLTLVENDLEPAALQQCAVLEEALSRVRQLPELVTAVTGSGSAFFCLSRDPAALRSAGGKIEKSVRKLLGAQVRVLRLPLLPV